MLSSVVGLLRVPGSSEDVSMAAGPTSHRWDDIGLSQSSRGTWLCSRGTWLYSAGCGQNHLCVHRRTSGGILV